MQKALILFLIFIISILGTSASMVFSATSNNATNIYSASYLPTIYITCDDFISESTDKNMLKTIKNVISGSANVIIDPNSPNPGEAPRAVKKAPNGTAAYIAAADPGSMFDLVKGVKNGYLKSEAQKLDAIVFINYGNFDLENTNYLPRSYDDNYSNPYFAGLYSPASFLDSAGIDLVQPNVGTSSQQEEINKIANGLVNVAYSSNKKFLNSDYNSSFVGIHQMNPTELASGSQEVLDGKNPKIGYSKWMYLTSQYVSGYPIKNATKNFQNSGNSGESTYFGVLTINEYRNAGEAVYNYMETNKTVPDSINVDGKKLRKPDLEYLFAKLTYDHTNKQNMTFPKYTFINKAYEPFEVITKYLTSVFYQIVG